MSSRLRVVLGLALLAMPVARPAVAQFGGQPQVQQTRTVEGKVVNKEGQPLASAIVYLKDTRTLQVKTFIAEPDGHFRFAQLSGSADYDLWAVAGKVRSSTKSISSFDNRKSLNFTLTVAAETPTQPAQ